MYTLVVSDSLAGRKISSILQSELLMSRALLQQLIQQDGVRVNQQPVFLTKRAELGDIIKIMLPKEHSEVGKEYFPIHVCFENDEILVVNKPPNMLTHPTSKERSGSLLAGIAGYLARQDQIPHSIHRLDRNTSGVILFAKHAHYHHLFDIALQRGDIHRDYIALIYSGIETLPTPFTWHTISMPIAQNPNQPSRRMISHETGQNAITHFRVLAQIGRVALLQFRLETGRTHQIRLHMASIGMPLIGDRDYTLDYASKGQPRDAHNYLRMLSRQALHAYHLSWIHPLTHEKKSVHAPVAADIEELWMELGGRPEVMNELQNPVHSLPEEINVCYDKFER